MSGSFKNRDGFIYFPHLINELEESMFSMQFDIQCDFDEQDIKSDLKQLKLLKRVCLYKVLLHVPEWFLSLMILGKESAKFKTKATTLYWKFYRNQITIEKFKKELTNIMDTGKII